MIGILGVTALCGGGGGGSILFDRTSGTNIGNMSSGGGLAAAFDGNANQAKAACAIGSNTTGYVGKTLPAARPVARVVVYPSNDNGFQHDAQTGESYSLTLYGKTGSAPANASDGTELATATGSDNAPSAVTIAANNGTSWDHVWVKNVPAAGDAQIAELEIYVA